MYPLVIIDFYHLMSLADLQANGMLQKLEKETDGLGAKISDRWQVLER